MKSPGRLYSIRPGERAEYFADAIVVFIVRSLLPVLIQPLSTDGLNKASIPMPDFIDALEDGIFQTVIHSIAIIWDT